MSIALLSSLEILNFGGLKGGIDLEFRNGITFIRGRNYWAEGDSNGTLKTTILNAVCWCLYGRTPKGATKFEVINRNAEASRVVLTLGDLSVTRSISSSGERLEFSHLGLLHSSVAPTKKAYRLTHVQEELNKHLGIDFHLFCNAIFVGPSSKTMRFLQAEPAARAKMLSVLVDAEVFQVMGSLIKDTIADREALLKDINQRIEFCKVRDIEVDDDIAVLKQSLKDMKEKDKVRSTFVLKEKKRIRREFEAAKEALNKAPSQSMEELNKDRTSLKSYLQVKGKEIYSAEAQLKKLGAFDDTGKCPLCTQPITEEHKKEVWFISETLQDRIEGWKIDYANAKEELEELEFLMEKCREEHRTKVTAQSEIDKLKAELVLLKDSALAPDMGPVKSMLKEKEDYKESNALQLVELKKQKKATETRIGYLTLGKAWMGNDIRNFMFDAIREKLAHYANTYLKFLAGEDWEVTFPVDRKREKFDVAVFKGSVEAPLSTLSEGEEWRIKMSMVLAFRSILMENVSMRYGVFFLDDSLGEVDEKGFEKFHELLSREKLGLLQQVIATVPKDNLINGADQVLTITRKPNDEVDLTYEKN